MKLNPHKQELLLNKPSLKSPKSLAKIAHCVADRIGRMSAQALNPIGQ